MTTISFIKVSTKSNGYTYKPNPFSVYQLERITQEPHSDGDNSYM